MDRRFQYNSEIQEILRIRKDLEFLKKDWSLPESEIRQILLIIEELFSNISRHAYTDKDEHVIEISLSLRDRQIDIEIIDDGIAFNPLDYRPGSASDPANSDAGGMGLTLIRVFSNDIIYQRDSGRNHLKITKIIKSK